MVADLLLKDLALEMQGIGNTAFRSGKASDEKHADKKQGQQHQGKDEHIPEELAHQGRFLMR